MSHDERNLWDETKIPESYVQGAGCEECRHTGYRGRTVIAEFLATLDEIGELISTASSTKTIEEVAVAQGMVPLYSDGLRTVLGHVTDLKEIQRVLG
jgi:type II secretory ATPase GspE/PulE/Tfp pilus assembly ATPase PilB-like protein